MGRLNTAAATESVGLVEVMFARTMGEATHCCELLRSQDISAQIEGAATKRSCGIAVMVPTDRFIEASEFLALNLESAEDEDLSDLDEDEEEEDDDADEFDDDDDEIDDDDEEEEEEEFGTEDDV